MGVPNAKVTCGKCEGSVFNDFSDLRKHQWAEHPEIFKNARRAAKKRAKAGLRKRAHTTTALVRRESARNGDMLVSELLAQLQDQQIFLNDAVSLISSIAAQHKENK